MLGLTLLVPFDQHQRFMAEIPNPDRSVFLADDQLGLSTTVVDNVRNRSDSGILITYDVTDKRNLAR